MKMEKEKEKDSATVWDRRLWMPTLWGTLGATILTGILLAVYYIPTFSQAFLSVQRLNDQIPFGWMIRRIHAVGAYLVLVVAFIHLLRIYITGNYKGGVPQAWFWGGIFFFLSILAHFSGFLLPLSQSAFWGTHLVLSNIAAIPYIGGSLADFLRGGKELGGGALIRFYSLHIGLSLVMILLLFHHDRWLIRQERKGEEMVGEQKNRRTLFLGITAGLLIAGIGFFPGAFTDPLREIANPLVNPERVAPPAYFLFVEETFKFFSATYPALSFALLILLPCLFLFLPWIDRSPEKNLLNRPVALSIGSGILMVVLYFTLIGVANARYGQKVILPDRPLTREELRGAQVFVAKNCAYCHQVGGQEGRREGPDLTVVIQRERTPEWIRRFTLNARLYQPGTTMPRYEMPLEDLEALSQYILSLDWRKGNLRAIETKEFLENGDLLMDSGGLPGEGKK